MIITICGSSTFRKEMLAYKDQLLHLGHEVILHPDYEAFVRGEKKELWEQITHEHHVAKKEQGYIKRYYDAITRSDAILVLNFDKKGVAHYIGGNTLMEMGFAYVSNKKIFLLYDVPELSYTDEIKAMYDVILHGDLEKIQ